MIILSIGIAKLALHLGRLSNKLGWYRKSSRHTPKCRLSQKKNNILILLNITTYNTYCTLNEKYVKQSMMMLTSASRQNSVTNGAKLCLKLHYKKIKATPPAIFQGIYIRTSMLGQLCHAKGRVHKLIVV